MHGHMTHPQAGAVSVGPHHGEPVARLVLASHSKGNDGGEVVDHKILQKDILNSIHTITKTSCKHNNTSIPRQLVQWNLR